MKRPNKDGAIGRKIVEMIGEDAPDSYEELMTRLRKAMKATPADSTEYNILALMEAVADIAGHLAKYGD